MECLVLGLGFVMEVPNEVFWYSDELVQAISHPAGPSASGVSLGAATLNPFSSPPKSKTAQGAVRPPAVPSSSEDDFPRPSPNPPQYSLSFDANPTPAQFPCLLVNIGSGVSIIKIDDYGKFERISGTSLGGGTLWGLLSLLTGAKSFDGKATQRRFSWRLTNAARLVQTCSHWPTRATIRQSTCSLETSMVRTTAKSVSSLPQSRPHSARCSRRASPVNPRRHKKRSNAKPNSKPRTSVEVCSMPSVTISDRLRECEVKTRTKGRVLILVPLSFTDT